MPAEGRVPELIDDPMLDPARVRATLSDQAWINAHLWGNAAVLRYALPFLRACTSDPLRVLDLACGGADHCRALAQALRRAERRVEIVALDRGERVLACAREWSRECPEVAFACGDARTACCQPRSFDAVILANTLHHLAPGDAVAVLRNAAELSRGLVVVADLLRAPWAAQVLWLLGGVLPLDEVSRSDGSVSLRQAYAAQEMAALAMEAGWVGFQVRRRYPLRATLLYRPPWSVRTPAR